VIGNSYKEGTLQLATVPLAPDTCFAPRRKCMVQVCYYGTTARPMVLASVPNHSDLVGA
jgi:hypothetical protein